MILLRISLVDTVLKDWIDTDTDTDAGKMQTLMRGVTCQDVENGF
jgi:hypothetical protein